MEQVVFGGRMNIPKGTTFFKTGENVEHVYLLVNGQVRAKSEYMKMNLDNGALLGILDIYSEEYLFACSNGVSIDPSDCRIAAVRLLLILFCSIMTWVFSIYPSIKLV